MKIPQCSIALVLLLFVQGACEAPRSSAPLAPPEREPIFKQQVIAVYQTKSRVKAIKRAETGRAWSEGCLGEGEAACLYYHMIFTGLYYKYRVVGYQEGLARMIEEAETLIALDASYEEGGVYRVLGNIYLSAPSFSLKKEPVLKDLARARRYAELALHYGPENPENLLLMGKILWEKGEKETARPYFEQSLARLPRKGFYKKRERELIKEVKNYLK